MDHSLIIQHHADLWRDHRKRLWIMRSVQRLRFWNRRWKIQIPDDVHLYLSCLAAEQIVTDFSNVSSLSRQVIAEVERAVVGKRLLLEMMMASVLAGGHILLEDFPGLGKTLVARSFATALGLDFKRIQFTPDLLPADLLGSTVYDMQSGRFEFRSGPIFTNLLLADEINRTPPKTQAALLEAMAEGQV